MNKEFKFALYKVLDEDVSVNATCVKFAQVQKEGSREINRKIDFYNLGTISEGLE